MRSHGNRGNEVSFSYIIQYIYITFIYHFKKNIFTICSHKASLMNKQRE